jgi:phosphoribosyl 1,2-cyclic phosphate phosphodiesterase
MKITFLGTGTSQGVPLIACACKVCTSANKKDKRLRTSLLIETETTTVCIDTGPDFRYQMLRANNAKLDAVIFTHGHKDHVAGLDDIRAYNYILKKNIDVYASKQTTETLAREFPYIFDGTNYPGIPQINMHLINKDSVFTIGDITIEVLPVMHYKMEVFGFKINGTCCYITDANFIEDTVLHKIKNTNVLVLNALRNETHISHFSLDQAITIGNESNAKQIYFTHVSHQLGLYDDVNKQLPQNMQLAYDCLSINL